MTVWKMNLNPYIEGKDKFPNKTFDPFCFCGLKRVIAIGWLYNGSWNSYDEYINGANKVYAGSSDFKKAFNAFNSLQFGDLVLLNDPTRDKYYVCRVLDDAPKADKCEEFKTYGFSAYRSTSEFYEWCDKSEIEKISGFSASQCRTRATVEHIRDTALCEKIYEFYKSKTQLV